MMEMTFTQFLNLYRGGFADYPNLIDTVPATWVIKAGESDPDLSEFHKQLNETGGHCERV